MREELRGMLERAKEAQEQVIEKKIKEVYEIREEQKELDELAKKSGVLTDEAKLFLLKSNEKVKELIQEPKVLEKVHEEALEIKKVREKMVRGWLNRKDIDYPTFVLTDFPMAEQLREETFNRAAPEERKKLIDIYEGVPPRVESYAENLCFDEEFKRSMEGMDYTKEGLVDFLKTNRVIDICGRFYKQTGKPEEKERLLDIIKSYSEDESDKVKKHAEKTIEELTKEEKKE